MARSEFCRIENLGLKVIVQRDKGAGEGREGVRDGLINEYEGS